MKKEKPNVGKRLFSLNVGNAARHREQTLTPVIVTKVGRKYFTCATDERHGRGTEFHIDTWCEKTNYSANEVLYESEEDYYNEVEAKKLCRMIYEAFEYGRNQGSVSLPSLRAIVEIISGDKG